MARFTTDGVTDMETILAAVTVNGTEVVAEPSVAVIVTNPGAVPNARPFTAPMFTMLASDTDHVT